jgi:hypothetical protein
VIPVCVVCSIPGIRCSADYPKLPGPRFGPGQAHRWALSRYREVRKADRCGARLNSVGEFGEGRCESIFRVDIRAEFVVAAAHVLDKGVSGADHSSRAQLFEAAHRPQPSLESSMIGCWMSWCPLPAISPSSTAITSSKQRVGEGFVRGHRARVGAVIQSRIKNRRVAAKSRFSDTRTSMTWPYWSIARYK